jgi:excinuclease ABC subunit C
MIDKDPFQAGIKIILDTVKTLPLKPGVYRMLDTNGQVLYIGKAKNLKNRVRSYTMIDQLPIRLKRMVFSTAAMEIISTKTEVEALILESQLIKKLQPKYNVLLKDDKSFPHIYIQKNHDFPQIYKKRGINDQEAYCFGPFATIDAVETTIVALQKVFKLRNCTDSFFATRQRPCLQYHIKRCTAPCVERVTLENYQQQVKQAIDFLKGKSQDIQKALKSKMTEAAAKEEYELAAIYRDQIKDLHKIQSHSIITPVGLLNADVIAVHEENSCVGVQVFFIRHGQNYGNRSYFPKHTNDHSIEEILEHFILQFYESRPAPREIYLSHKLKESNLIAQALTELNRQKIKLLFPKQGDKKRFMDHVLSNAEAAVKRKLLETANQKDLLHKLARFLELPESPERIEVYDNSHIQGRHSVGSFIVAGEEGFMKQAYRKFTIKDSSVFGDDFGMMREVFYRRFTKSDQDEYWSFPDVVIIDGGIGQLNAALKVLEELQLPQMPVLMAISKGPERNAGKEKILLPGKPAIQLDFNDPLLFFIQRLRDEAHRFVIETHRKKRSIQMTLSALDEIPGIGPKRKKALLHYFGSVKSIKDASTEQLEQVSGISPIMAQTIYKFFNPES